MLAQVMIEVVILEVGLSDLVRIWCRLAAAGRNGV